MVGPHRWYYVEPFGLCVLQETLSSTGAYVLTTAPKIPWRHVERALRICKRWKRERPK